MSTDERSSETSKEFTYSLNTEAKEEYEKLNSNNASIANILDPGRLSNVIKMPTVGKTKSFPRVDNFYQKKESLPYDEAQTKLWVNREKNYGKEKLMEWIAYAIVGLLCGTVAFIMILMEEKLLGWINSQMQYFIRGECNISKYNIEEL